MTQKSLLLFSFKKKKKWKKAWKFYLLIAAETESTIKAETILELEKERAIVIELRVKAKIFIISKGN